MQEIPRRQARPRISLPADAHSCKSDPSKNPRKSLAAAAIAAATGQPLARVPSCASSAVSDLDRCATRSPASELDVVLSGSTESLSTAPSSFVPETHSAQPNVKLPTATADTSYPSDSSFAQAQGKKKNKLSASERRRRRKERDLSQSAAESTATSQMPKPQSEPKPEAGPSNAPATASTQPKASAPQPLAPSKKSTSVKTQQQQPQQQQQQKTQSSIKTPLPQKPLSASTSQLVKSAPSQKPLKTVCPLFLSPLRVCLLTSN